ncbi:MAG: PepSY domain-containing protein [Candidatus Thermoplasmatota archaeon]|nr:PepSY domain-containing protein [Candidatus Thermoplasmatota archaeon]
MKYKNKIIGIILVGIMMGVISLTVVGIIPLRETVGPVGEPNPRHVILELDPAEVETNISEDQAIQIIRNTGYTPLDPEIGLIKAEDWGKLYWEIVWWKEEEPVSLKVDANNGDIIGITDFGAYKAMPENVSKENAIVTAKEKIEGMAKVPEDAGKPIIEIKKRFCGNVFSVSWKPEVKGILVEKSFMNIELDPAGNVISFRKVWHEIDIDTKATVTKEEAIKVAKEKALSDNFPQLLRKRVQEAEYIHTELVIKRPTHFLDKSKPLYGEYKLIWSVTFEKDQSLVEIQIDAHSGEYTGIDFTK